MFTFGDWFSSRDLLPSENSPSSKQLRSREELLLSTIALSPEDVQMFENLRKVLFRLYNALRVNQKTPTLKALWQDLLTYYGILDQATQKKKIKASIRN